MIGIRQKLSLGFGSLVAVIVIIGTMTMLQINRLGLAIDVILRENYRSVVTCQNMKEALERMDSGILYTLSGNDTAGNRLTTENISHFRSALAIEMGNITLPGEQDKARHIERLFEKYTKEIPAATSSERSLSARQTSYFSTLQPLFLEIKRLAQDILEMNQANMNAANNAARRQADMVYKQMLIAILTATLLAFLFSYLAQRWILHPIKQLFESTNEIRNGHLDLVLKTGTGDEIGQLSESFNEMASALRKVREKDRINLVRTQRATEDVFKALPSAIAVLDLDGRVEVATETAEHHFGLKPGVLVDTLGYEWLPPLIRKARDENRVAERDPKSGYVQQFIGDREYFFQPTAVPIPLDGKAQEPRGIAVLLKDVTRVQEQQELKLGVVATVLHQLRTPLTSLRMSIHLMLEERIGELNDTQSEILIAAREESERLTDILDELQNLHRIESGMPDILPEPVEPIALARSALEQFLVVARDKGIELVNTFSDELPEVMADTSKIKHVFVNLLSNALRFTSPGGSITIGASAEAETVRFYVEDTGTGISEEALKHLFEKFYRAPGQDKESGVGLGLSIVKEIVRAHGGDVGVESVVGKGSVFHFTLPLRMVKTENTVIKPMEE